MRRALLGIALAMLINKISSYAINFYRIDRLSVVRLSGLYAKIYSIMKMANQIWFKSLNDPTIEPLLFI